MNRNTSTTTLKIRMVEGFCHRSTRKCRLSSYNYHMRSSFSILLTVVIITILFSPSARAYDDPLFSLSEYDDLNQMIESGFPLDHAELIIHRCTMGIAGADGLYAKREAQAEELDIKWGAYAFLHQADKEDARLQAKAFLRRVVSLRGANKRIVLAVDWLPYPYRVETYSVEPNLSAPTLQQKYMSPNDVADFSNEVYALTGVRPIVHISIGLLSYFSAKEAFSPEVKATLSRSPLWIGAIGQNVDLPKGSPWKSWTFWFHTSHDFPKVKNTDEQNRRISPDLSFFNEPRGSALDHWYDKHSWDFRLKGEL
jgi:hypothetical protein